MKKIPKASYRSVDELEQYIVEREAEALTLPCGAARQSVLIEVSKLRVYADFKRLLAPAPRKSSIGVSWRTGTN